MGKEAIDGARAASDQFDYFTTPIPQAALHLPAMKKVLIFSLLLTTAFFVACGNTAPLSKQELMTYEVAPSNPSKPQRSHSGQICTETRGAAKVNDKSVDDIGEVAHPLHGFVEYTNAGKDAVIGMTIDCFTADGKKLIASTRTDRFGEFSFPQLKTGDYYLKGSAKGVPKVEAVVHVRKTSNDVACFDVETK